MEWKKLILDGYERIPQELAEIMEGLQKADLDWQPHPECNSIGWTAWHLVRVQDSQIADLMGEEQVYIREKWYAKFKRLADPGDSGFGDTPQDVAEFKSPNIDVFLGYLRSSTDRSKRYINSISESDLERVLNEPWFRPLPTVAVRLVSILADGHHHIGEVSYVRGLRQAPSSHH